MEELFKEIDEKLQNESNVTKVNSYAQYIRDIGSIPLLTKEEEQYLFKCLKEKDTSSRDKLILANLRLVIYVIRKYPTLMGIDQLDLVQAGNLALINAVEKYDITKNISFSVYAIQAIKRTLSRYIKNNQRLIRVPVSIQDELYKYSKLHQEYYTTYGEEIQDDYAAKLLKIKINRLKYIKQYINIINIPALSLIDSFKNNEEEFLTLEDTIEKEGSNIEDIMVKKDIIEKVQSAVNKLPEKRRRELKLHFGLDNQEPLKLKDVAYLSGCTYQAAQQREKETLKKLSKIKSLKEFIE